MGGALAVHIGAKKVLPSLAGLVVVDVVEVGKCMRYFCDAPVFMKLRLPLFIYANGSCIKISGHSNGFVDSYAENSIKSNATFLHH